MKYLPHAISRRFQGRAGLQAILSNSSWLAGDKLLRLVVGMPITIWIARYLGPDLFGMLSFAIAFVSVFGAIASSGLDSVVVRELVREPARAKEIIGTAFIIKLVMGTVAFLGCLVALIVMGHLDERTFLLVAIIAAGLVFQSFGVIDFWFQSRVQSKFAVQARMVAFLASSTLKAGLVITGATIEYFAFVTLAEVLIGAACLYLVYSARVPLPGHRFRLLQARALFRESWPLLLGGITIILYMRVDMVMLQQMTDSRQVGIYAAATRLSEVWYALPVILASSVFPAILRSHHSGSTTYLNRVRQLYFTFAWLAIGVSLPMSLCANWLVAALYGAAFAPAGPVLMVHSWATVAVFLGIASSQHLLAENLQIISLYRTAIGLIFNVGLNFILIPQFEALGAAIATALSYFIATFAIAFFHSTRDHAWYLLISPFARP